MNKTLKNIVILVLILLIQHFVINNIQLDGRAHPFICVYLLFLFHHRYSRTALMFVALVSGLFLDILSGNYGLHSSALVFAAFLRPYLFSMIIQEADSEDIIYPHINSIGLQPFIILLGIYVLIFQSFILVLEAFTFQHFPYLLLNILLGSVFSFLFIFVLELVLFRKA